MMKSLGAEVVDIGSLFHHLIGSIIIKQKNY